MDKNGAKFKFVGHSTEIIRQSKNKGTLGQILDILYGPLLQLQNLKFKLKVTLVCLLCTLCVILQC